MSLTRPTITGFSGFWDLCGDALPYNLLPLANNGNRGHVEPKIAKLFKQEDMREIQAALAAVIGAAAGGAISKTYKRRQAQTITPVDVGAFASGNITVETNTVISRNSTAADVTYLKQIFSGRLTASNITYPTELSGNQNQGPAAF